MKCFFISVVFSLFCASSSVTSLVWPRVSSIVLSSSNGKALRGGETGSTYFSEEFMVMKKKLESLLSSNCSNVLELEAMYNEHVAMQRDLYFEGFCSALIRSKAKDLPAVLLLKDEYMHKFKILLNNSLPLNCPKWWSWKGAYQEYADDITSFIEEELEEKMKEEYFQQRGNDEENNTTTQEKSAHFSVLHPSNSYGMTFLYKPGQWQWLARLKKSKYYTKYRWLAVQLSLLAVRFAQNDFNRRIRTRSARRRLAEVPEFPLL